MKTTKTYTYYTRMRPPGPGCQPSNGLLEVKDYDGRKATDDGILAWGEVTYNRPLSETEISDYELTLEVDK